MPVLQDPDMLQLNRPELYNAWKGQLYIQEHLACDIKFKSSRTCSIPAQLPSKLEIKEVIRLSELRKALPVQFFDKISLTGQEVCCESVYYTVYAIITSAVNGFEFDKLQEWMKDRELALIKVLNDQGFLILLTSSALQCSKDLRVKDSFQLFALFLFPHTKLFANTGREDWGYKFAKEDISLKITELLPGLQYAILETRQMQKGKDINPDALVEQHFKQFANLQRKNVRIGEVKAKPSDASNLPSCHEKDIPNNCDQLAFSRLQSYFSSPLSFSVPLVKMSSLLKEDVPLSSDSEKCGKKITVMDSVALDSKIPLLAANKIKSGSSSGNHILNENKKQPTSKRTFKKGGRRRTRKGKRKHTPQTALSSSATSENQVSTKTKKLTGGDQQQAVSSSKTTVKLASAPFTHRRKRGAEVLTAEFVSDDKVSETEPTVPNKRNKEQNTVLKSKIITGKQRKIASAEETQYVRDRPPKRKASEPGNRNKLPEVKAKSEVMRRAVMKHQEQSGKQFGRRTRETVNTVPTEPVGSFSKSSMALNLTTKQSTSPTPVPENNIMEKRISMYESHALNLLADLALNSLSSSSISYLSSESVAPISEPVVQESVPKSDSGNAVENTQNECSPVLELSTASEEPVQISDCVKSQPKVGSDVSQVNNTTQQRPENTEKQTSHKVLIAAAKAKARNNATSKISLEHSYSQLPRDDIPGKSSKELNEKPLQSVSEPTVTSPEKDTVVDQSEFFPREFQIVTSDNGCPSLNTEPQEKLKFQDNFVVTFKWEAKYDFDLDSKFTSDPLEKTINRALHGPWNPNLKEKVEDVKIILHMWLALFYSKPSQLLNSSSRKVVEHSNPAKYVSINTVHDPLYEIAETDDVDSRNGEESDPQRTLTPPHIMSDDSPVWHEMKKNHSSNQPVDLSFASRIHTKDYNIKLSSEIFQMYNQSSLSALYTNSLQTTVMCKMTSTSKVAPPPPNYMNTIFSANVPTVCYTDDRKQFNTELTAKSETCVAIGGGSSGKDNTSESEHRYSKHFSIEEETEESSSSEKSFSMLYEDSCSAVCKNDSSAENSDSSVSPGPMSDTKAKAFSLHDARLPLIGDENHQATTRSEVIPLEFADHASSTVDNEDVSLSDALNMNCATDVFHEDNEHSDHSEATDEDFLKKSSPLFSLTHSMQNIHTYSEQHETIFVSAEGRDILEAKLQDVNMHSNVRQTNEEKELDTPNVHLVVTSSNNSELGRSMENAIHNSKSSCFGENPTNVKFCNEDLSHTASLNYGSNTAPLKDGKVLESGMRHSDGSLLTPENPKAARISLELVQSESQEQVTSNMDSLTESNKEGDFCADMELNDSKDSSVDLEFTANSVEEAAASSSTNEEILGKTLEQSSDKRTCQKELLAKNDTHENAEFATMAKLELSPSSHETSDFEDMDNVEKTVPESPEKMDEETLHSNDKPDLVDTCAEVPVPIFFGQDDARSPENDGCQVNMNTIAMQFTDHIAEMNGMEKTAESLPVHSQSPFPPCDLGADRIDSLTAVSTDFKEKGTEAVDSNVLHSDEGENLPEIDNREDPPDNTHALCDQEVSAEQSEEDTKTCLGENSSLFASESSKAADLECLGENSSLIASESSKAVDLEILAKESSMFASESSKAVDLECLSVFEKLSLKAVKETCTTQISTLARKPELRTHNIESLLAEKATMDNNPTVELLTVQTDLCDSHVLNTEDHMVPNNMETGTSCELLQGASSDALNKVIPAIILVGKSNSNEITQDSDAAINQSVSRCVDRNVDHLPVESQSDSTSDAVSVRLSPDQPEKSSKDQIPSMRNTIRKEILSKLKRICQGSGIGQHTSSNSEDEVFIVHEKPGKCHTEEQSKQTDIKVADLSEHEILTVSLAESTSETQENQTPESNILEEKIVQEIPESNSITSAEPVVGQQLEPLVSQDKCISPLRDDLPDNMDQDPGQDQSEICCILNTGSISKEQYDRWSETSDEDIEFIQAYKEPPTHKTSKYFHKECLQLPSCPAEAHTSCPEPNHSRKAKHYKRLSGPSTSLWETNEYVSRYHRDPDYPNSRSHGSLIIAKNVKDVGRTWHTVHKEGFSAGRSDLDSLFTNRRMVSSDLTQNTLDMEHLRFMCRLKDVLRKSSTDVHVSEPPFQTMFDSRRIPGCSSSRTKSLSPLLVTVHCTYQRRDYRAHDSVYPSSSYSQAYYGGELREKPAYYSRTPKKVRTHRYSPPYHFNRLRYESSLEKSNSDISVIIKECTQSNHLKLSHVSLGSNAVERTSACPVPEESGGWPMKQTFDSTSTKSQTVGNIISDLCTNLHTRLHSVARETAQKIGYFYLSKTIDDQEDDDDFFSLTKSLLIKDGYTPIKPEDFCNSEQSESNKLLVIIRNENVSSQIHKIPCLLQLRLHPNVTFAGVDTPEDLSDSMYQELLQTGGFVVSDKALLENITIEKLKDVLTVLEKMNRNSAWKWLVHYGEYRTLKEDKRAESVSRTKIPLLKSYQQSNVIEILPYHRCDSRPKDLSSDLECLLNLQSQHIRSRLAVYLTVTPSTEAEELEQIGILVYDVDTFIRRIQKVDAQLQPSFWS